MTTFKTTSDASFYRTNYFFHSSFFFRLIRLLEEIMSEKENKTIIFVETKRRCDDLTRRMRRDG